MKKQFLLFIITLLFASASFAATPRFDAGEEVNVWALKGLALYKQPGIGNVKILTIPYGKSIKVLSSKTDTLKVGQIKLSNVAVSGIVKGYWIKVNYNGREGYVFDGYLSKMPCFRIGKYGQEEVDQYFKHMYKGLTSKLIKGKYDSKQTTYYFNGRVILKEGYSDGCFDEEIHLLNVTAEDLELFKNVHFTGADAAEDIKVKKDKIKGEYIITCYSCT